MPAEARGPVGGCRTGRRRLRRRRRVPAHPRGEPVRDRVQRHAGAQDADRRTRRSHLAESRHQSRGGHRLPQGHDGGAHGALRGRDGESAGHAGGLPGAAGRWHRGRRAGHRAGGARPGRTAGVRHRRRRLPAVLRRRVGQGAGLRRPRGGPGRRDRELPALDLRHRPHRAQAGRQGVGPVHRRARHRADARGRPPGARQVHLA